ncbi:MULTISPECIES: hypothetical protein [Delftia]|uniref:Dolichyl-phosphate-mannose-protein mannosyltransferase n=1 Tax=Delftia lacustris TaxID=558537 RepID=A0A1H3PG05_9BURK|nr:MULTISPECIES: hypothetical protein [Delftia]MXN29788.1 hypothetical protein [Delftia sp. CH05]SDZ00026.1 hypothetical protein SAMN05421547_110147 [Delftia lacustris]
MNTMITQRHSFLRFSGIFLLIAIIYLAWLVACWPGILGQDSLAIMLQVDTQRKFESGKPVFWYMYNLLFYGTTGRTEVPIGVQLLICAIICARILFWMLERQLYKSFAYCLFFVALAPSVVFYASSMYSDGVYAVTLSGMLFEAWRCIRRRQIDSWSAFIFLLTIPFAIFSRPNGIINFIPLLVLGWVLARPQRLRLLAIVIPWCTVMLYGHISFKSNYSIGTIFPVALYETVGFLEHRPMGLWEHNQPRITPKTLEALTSLGSSIEHIQEFYDHYYWDPLVFFPQGPALLSLSKKDRRTIVREFFKYNLWHNFPAFAASRVNIFLYSALANGGFPGPTYNKIILPQTKSISKPNIHQWVTDKPLLDYFEFSMNHRGIFWAPWVGLILIFMASYRFIKNRNLGDGVVAATYTIQLAAVFIFSIAGEYRYLLAFFTAPLVLLPLLQTSSQDNV